MDDSNDRMARLRELAGVMVGMSVQDVKVHSSDGRYPVGLPDLFLARPPGVRPAPGGPDGELRLWVLTWGWRLESCERVIAAPKDPPRGLGDAVGILAGRLVTGLEIDVPGPDTTIWFGDLRLRLFPVSTLPAPDGTPAWMLRMAPGVSLVVGPGGEWGISRRRRKETEAEA